MEFTVNGKPLTLHHYAGHNCYIDYEDLELIGYTEVEHPFYVIYGRQVVGYISDFYAALKKVDPECVPCLPQSRAMEFILLLTKEQDVRPLLDSIRSCGEFRPGMVKYLEPLTEEQREWIDKNFPLTRLEKTRMLEWINMKEKLTLAERLLKDEYVDIRYSDLKELESSVTSDEQREWLKKYVY